MQPYEDALVRYNLQFAIFTVVYSKLTQTSDKYISVYSAHLENEKRMNTKTSNFAVMYLINIFSGRGK